MESKDATKKATSGVTRQMEPPAVDEPPVAGTGLDRPMGRRVRRRWVPALVAALIVLVVGAAMAIVTFSGSGDDVIDDRPVTPTTAAPQTPTTDAPQTEATSAPEIPAAPVTLSNIQGLWYAVEADSYVRNNGDGTFEVAKDRLGLDSNPVFEGRIEVSGDTVTLIASASSANCEEGDTGHYRIEIIDPGHHRTTLIDEECAARGGLQVINYERPAPRPNDLIGTWYGVEPRSWTRNDADGTYVGAGDQLGLDGDPPLQGRWELNGDILTIIASAGSQVCDEGDTGHFRIEILDTDRYRMHFIDDECAFRREWAVITYQPSP